MGNIPGIEKQRMAEQQRLDALKNAAERNRLGQFATPPEFARDMIRYVKGLWKSRSDPISFLDPAIGTGAFFSALKQGIPGDSIRRCAGFEIDTAFAETGRRLWQREGLQVTTGDFMVQPPPDKCKRFNLILANPPYVRHHHLPARQKERCKAAVEQEIGLKISGLAGLYCYFLLLADRWLTDDGIGIWLIPSEFMTVNYGEAVKRYLLEQIAMYQSLDIGSVQMRWHAGECRYQRLSDPLGVYRAAKGTVTPPNSTSMWYRYGAGKTQAGRLRPTKHLCRIVERVQDDRISKIGFRK
eukprot:XP_019858389.1 PREDICTED: uncharacterized protein LOC109586638 [Amphimedon queenslandica]